MRVVIVDDEALARARLRRLLGSEADVEIVAECADGIAALEAVKEHAPDVLLLDVQMPEMDGFDVVRNLEAEKLPAIVFVTAYDQHAVKAFEARALDYLLKPTSQARVQEALGRVRERMRSTPETSLPQSLLDLLASREAATSRPKRLAVRSGERTSFVVTDDVDWFEAAGNYVVLHVGKETHIVRETMSALETQLAGGPFLRVSRSAILNLQRVKELQSITAGEHVAILHDGQKIAITRSIREIEEKLRFA
ncbi:MAG: LytR/AlgR family response regulator transcription factor [Chthoniobacteraceae bacterium]